MELAQQLVNGLTLGSLYALIAVGYTVVYGIIQLINFAHGEIFMVGAFGALSTALLFFRGYLDGGEMLPFIPMLEARPWSSASRMAERAPERR